MCLKVVCAVTYVRTSTGDESVLPTREKRRLDRPEGIVMLNSLQDLHNVRFRHGLSECLYGE